MVTSPDSTSPRRRLRSRSTSVLTPSRSTALRAAAPLTAFGNFGQGGKGVSEGATEGGRAPPRRMRSRTLETRLSSRSLHAVHALSEFDKEQTFARPWGDSTRILG